jgi:hypothetical protein
MVISRIQLAADWIEEVRMPDQMTDGRIEQRELLRTERVPHGATIVVRGGSDTRDKLRRHAERTARAWSLDGQPLFGISVFAVLGMPLDDLLRQRLANFGAIYLPTAAQLVGHGFELLPTGQRPHFTVRLRHADVPELDRLLAALGDLRPNPQYAKGRI